MLSETIKNVLVTVILILFAVTLYSAAADQAVTSAEPNVPVTEPSKEAKSETTKKKHEPASRFVPSEKLRADDAISFPADI
jgi:hypothetical protein